MADTDITDLPQLETVFDQPKLNVDEHEWIQQGYFIIEQCHEGRGIPIPSGKMLVKKDGGYDLVDEVSR